MTKQTKSQIPYCISKLQHMAKYGLQNILMKFALLKHNGILIKTDTTYKDFHHRSQKKYSRSSYSLEKSVVKEQCNDRMTWDRKAQPKKHHLKILSIGNYITDFWHGFTF